MSVQNQVVEAVFEVILLGIVQGVTEFLPVSSSGHLALVRLIMGQDSFTSEVAFDVILHVATLLSVVIAFRKALWQLLTEERHLLVPLAISTACLVVALLPVGDDMKVKDWIKLARTNGWALAAGFTTTAVLLTVIQFLDIIRGTKPKQGEAESPSDTENPPANSLNAEVSWKQALLIGVFQLFALVPGISRSGSTLSAGLFTGMSRDRAFDYAFLMSIPAILGATVVEASKIKSLASLNPVETGVGFVVALVTGVLSITLLRWMVSRDQLWIFVPYLLFCAVVALFY